MIFLSLCKIVRFVKTIEEMRKIFFLVKVFSIFLVIRTTQIAKIFTLLYQSCLNQIYQMIANMLHAAEI